jgi:hypothetical protein
VSVADFDGMLHRFNERVGLDLGLASQRRAQANQRHLNAVLERYKSILWSAHLRKKFKNLNLNEQKSRFYLVKLEKK